ncbi:MAG TPA: mechanosensitive ion channel family protein [Treponemataceae bacterium]|nr:mechanosensitive ion channel family protein [Treponemataceae bacterium]
MEHYITPILDLVNLPDTWRPAISILVSLAVLVLLALLVRLAGKLVNTFIVAKAIRRSRTTWDDILMDHGIFSRAAGIVTVLVLMTLYPVFITETHVLVSLGSRILLAWLILLVMRLVARLLDATNEIYKEASPEIAKRKPVKGYLQMVKIFLYIVGGILVVTGILNVSPVGILSGFGAMSAVLMLVFKDSIMGFVASLQLTGNDLVRIGDWIEMPKYGADGDVIDITLQTIQVRNWDMTITSIPIYALISDSFKNWRGMSEAGGRRARRTVFLDMKAVRFLRDEELDRLQKLPLLAEYLTAKRAEIAEHNTRLGTADDDIVSPRHLTNLGTFRAYVLAYLRAHPMVSKELTCMVRYLETTAKGIPMELYFFSTDKAWVNYEAIQSDIIDHILSVMGAFGLRVFQDLSGADFTQRNTFESAESR